MAQYARSGVTFRDVALQLPQLPGGLLWRLSLYPRVQNTSTLSPTVELCMVLPNTATIVLKRWGGEGRTGSTDAIMSSLLIAAQQAHNYVQGLDINELVARLSWDLGLPHYT